MKDEGYEDLKTMDYRANKTTGALDQWSTAKKNVIAKNPNNTKKGKVD